MSAIVSSLQNIEIDDESYKSRNEDGKTKAIS